MHDISSGLRLIVERLFVERLLADGQLMEGQHVKITKFKVYKAVADPGFPVGGRGPRRGAWTPETVTFRKCCMSKRKNLGP